MPRTFDVLTQSPASVEEIHAAFSREDYWLARIALGNAATTTLDSLIVDADGTVTVRVTQHLGRQLLPGPVAKFAPGNLKLVHSETWKAAADGRVRGQVDVTTSPGLGSGRSEAWLEPADNGDAIALRRASGSQNPVGGRPTREDSRSRFGPEHPRGTTLHHHLDRRKRIGHLPLAIRTRRGVSSVVVSNQRRLH